MRIPPPLVAVAAAAAQRALANPTARPTAGRAALTTGIVLASGWMAGATARRFRRHGTTVDPMHPEQASTLVTTGPNSISRNPMYLGLAGLLLAHAAWRGSWAGLVPIAGYVVLVDRIQIEAEESALLEKFGAEYESYRTSVPRWIGPSSLNLSHP